MAVPLRVGDVVVDKYRIERQLGAGGMGVVLQATHLQLNQSVALKFLVDSPLEAHVAAERFLREARATFRLRSEHTVRVMDVGTLASGEPFMVMELLEGKDFKQLLADRGPLPPAEAALYMIQACNALQEAHACGIVHRDFKARNVMVTKRVDGSPCVKVLDFGISKINDGADAAPLTQPDIGMGSPRYMAPEQWTSASTVDARADIYAAGAVLYELLTGQIPLAGLPLVEVIKRIRAGAVPSPKEIRPDLPEALCRVVMKALRPRPEERFPTADHFAQALREALPGADAQRSRPAMAMTVPTAVVDRDALLARAAVRAHLPSSPSSSVPTPQEARLRPQSSPDAPSTDPDPPAAPAPLVNDFAEDVATLVTRSPMDDRDGGESPNHATLQVAEVPPEIQALRNKFTSLDPPRPPAYPMAAPPLAVQAGPALPRVLDETADLPNLPPAPPPPFFEPTVDDVLSRRAAMNVMNMQAPLGSMGHFSHAPQPLSVQPQPARRVPTWLFWTFLVLSFCFAGGVAAALLTRFL
jgi:serine/threonine protein kinase